MTVDNLKDKLNGIPAHYNVVTHIKVKGKNKYIVVPVEDICIDVSGVVCIEGGENVELKARKGLFIDCEKAHKDGELCLGYGGDEDEPCEQCKNCIKCECGYYQLGETEKDEQLQKWKDEWQEQVQKATDEGYARTLQTMQLTKATEIIKTLADDLSMYSGNYQKELLEAKQFLEENSISEHIQRATHNYMG